MTRNPAYRRFRLLGLGALTLLALSGSARAQGKAAPEPQANAAPRVPGFLVTVPSSLGFPETVEAIKAAVEGQNMMVIKEINPQQMLRLVGVKANGMRQILFFHPRYMKRIIQANPAGGIEPPLKLVVMEKPNGKVVVRYVRPSYLLGRYAGLAELGAELDGVMQAIVQSIRG